MFQFFLNPWLLLGLAGIGLPIMAHLLSRRRFDVVEWGAMQFLNPSRKTRRRLKLEELLLLMLRIGLIALIVLAVTRPWIPGGWLSGYRSSGSRTVVLVIDGSNSMSRSDGVNSVHQNAIRRAIEFLGTLSGDDSVAIIDARDQPRSVIESPLRDPVVIEQELRKIPPPSGACSMMSALEKALAILGRSSSTAREVVVFSDKQANGWKAGDDAAWLRFDDQRKFPAVKPQVWSVDVTKGLAPMRRNVSVGAVELSREVTVPDFPVRLKVSVRNDSDGEVQIPVRLLQNGQAIAGETQSVRLGARSETVLEFDHAISAAGSHVLTVEADVTDDSITVDNSSHVAVYVAKSLPVLLINGSSSPIRSERATFFAELAFAPLEDRPPWILATVQDAAEVTEDDLRAASVVICCNVSRLSPAIALALRKGVEEGKGLIITCGPQTTIETFDACFRQTQILPQLDVVRTREAPPQADDLVRVAPLSIQPGWLDRFRSDPGRSLLKASFASWILFRTTPMNPVMGNAAANVAGANSGATATSAAQETAPTPVKHDPPAVLATFSNGDPFLMETRYGSGFVLLMTTTLDRTWNDLPTKSDFIPFLHEAVFHVSSAQSHRNVRYGEPLLAEMPWDAAAYAVAKDAPSVEGDSPRNDSTELPDFVFAVPGGQNVRVPVVEGNERLTATFRDTLTPGIYRSGLKFAGQQSADSFVVNYDHTEDEMVLLTDEDRARLVTNDRICFTDSLSDLTSRMYGDETVTELWPALLTIFLVFLMVELMLTRRAIRRGYGGEAIVRGEAA